MPTDFVNELLIQDTGPKHGPATGRTWLRFPLVPLAELRADGESLAMLAHADQNLRGTLTRMIAERGHAPTMDELARRQGWTNEATEASLRRLHEAHALLLHPGGTRPWLVHPFALSPGSCWVATGALGYWASCLYCAFGIAAALRRDATITTRLGAEHETVTYRIRAGEVEGSTDIFHLSTPVAAWWDNVIHACASFQPFRSEGDVEDWCVRHALPRGAILSLPALWLFARDWYGAYLQEPWRKRTREEVRALFQRHGLTSAFWQF